MTKKDTTMAILRSGLFGRISGKVGDYIYFTTKKGHQAVRRMPKPSTKEPTQAQLAQRARFRTIISFLRCFKPLFQILPKPVWPRNSEHSSLAFKQVHAEAVTGEFPDFKIDYAKVETYPEPLTFFGGLRRKYRGSDKLSLARL
jgi:hypothetical protein